MCVNEERLIITYYGNLADSHSVFEEPEARKRGGGPKPRSAAERIAHFWSQVKRDGDGCWEWQAARFKRGYGMFVGGRFNGKLDVRYAHRVAYELTQGPIPKGLVVMHSCDNRGCCNPAHLSVGTQKENLQDAIRKGRLDPWKPRPSAWTIPRAAIALCMDAPRGTVVRVAREFSVNFRSLYMAVRRERARRQRRPA